jgi:hypothetical protein
MFLRVGCIDVKRIYLIERATGGGPELIAARGV